MRCNMVLIKNVRPFSYRKKTNLTLGDMFLSCAPCLALVDGVKIGFSNFCRSLMPHCSVITATFIQLLIQQRIITLSNQYLVERDQLPHSITNVEAAVQPGDTKKHQMDGCFYASFGLASVVGYVGCFNVVQNSTSTIGPVSRLSLELDTSPAFNRVIKKLPRLILKETNSLRFSSKTQIWPQQRNNCIYYNEHRTSDSVGSNMLSSPKPQT